MTVRAHLHSLSGPALRRGVHGDPEREGVDPGEPGGRELWRPRLLRPQEDGRLQGGLPQATGKGMQQIQCCQMAKFDPFLSLDCARVEGVGRDQILQRSVAEP